MKFVVALVASTTFTSCSVDPNPALPWWAALVRGLPDPEIVTNSAFRRAIEASGLVWHVKDKKTGIELVLIPPGEYWRGASPGDDDARIDEKPRHRVKITNAFYLGRYEVTNAQYRAWRRGHASGERLGHTLDEDVQAVVEVSWEDAKLYCDAHGYRLPTEGEWEYAARAGTTTRHPWPGGAAGGQGLLNACDPLTENEFKRKWGAFPFDDGYRVTAPVGSFKPNGLGLYDTIGNVWEWCSDWHRMNEYARIGVAGIADPLGPGASRDRVLRGGSWDYGPEVCRVSTRASCKPSMSLFDAGFRVARAPR